MSREPTRRIRVLLLLVTASIACPSFAMRTVYAEDTEKNSTELLLGIMDLHAKLATNEVFLAQARLISAYLEAVQESDEPEKVKAYAKVLDILSRIRQTSQEVVSKRGPAPEIGESQGEARQGEAPKQDRRTVYEPGAALLEIFKADSIDTIPSVPVIRTYWTRDLSHSGLFLIPDRVAEIGVGSPYVARFAFYYEAKKPGRYGFTVIHKSPRTLPSREEGNICKLRIGGVDVADVTREPSRQGVCSLEKGFHRIEFYLTSKIPYQPDRLGQQMANFQVKILTPDSLDAAPMTKDMMLLKRE